MQQHHQGLEVVSRLVAKATPLYPHGDTARAYELFVSALEAAPDAPTGAYGHEDLDLGDIGFAGWAAFVCYDILSEVRDERWDKLLELIQKKSPVTAQRIRDQVAIHSVSQGESDEFSLIAEEVESLVDEDSDLGIIRAKIPRLVEIAQGNGAWWDLRDLANKICASKKHADIAWGLYNAALSISMSKSGKLASIYMPMGQLRKKEGAFGEAARLFLLSYTDMPTKAASEQLRICLRKLGVPGSGVIERDALLAAIQSAGRDAALAELERVTAGRS